MSTDVQRPEPRHLRRLWERMGVIYPHRWESALGTSPQREDGKLTLAGDTWARGLAGITPEQIGVGIDTCITRSEAWPPTLPEFRGLCLQIPSLDETRVNVTATRVTPTPFFRLVWQLLDTHRFRTARAEDSDRLLRGAYEAARDHAMRLRPLPEDPAGQLPPPVRAKEFDFQPLADAPRAEDEIDRLRRQLDIDSGNDEGEPCE